jgi:large subunit ribosomal protein L25
MDTRLEAVKRENFGKNSSRRLRREGKLPAVVYGGGSLDQQSTVSVVVDPKVLLSLMRSESGVNTLIGLKISRESETNVLVKEYQLDPVTHKLLHVDFYRVSMDKTIMVTVPIVLKGEAVGVKQSGGLLDFVNRDVAIECLPSEIPENIEADVTELELGHSLRLRDVLGEVAWKTVSDLDMMIVHVVAPRAEEETKTASEEAEAEAVSSDGEAGAEPEVIKKGKDEAAKEKE